MSATAQTMLKIVTSGLQDIERLNPPRGQPSLQFYRYVLKKRTRWASQWRRVEFDTRADFGKTATVKIPILGELITRATLVVELPDLYTPQAELPNPVWWWTNNMGHAICSNITMNIGTQVVEQFDSRLLEVLNEFEGPIEHFDSTNTMLAREPSTYPVNSQTTAQTLEIVFPFWWNRGPGPMALPIQALAKEDVRITCEFRAIQQLVYSLARTPNPANPTLPPLPTMAGYTLRDASGSSPAINMPTNWRLKDAYWIIEYVSLEDREAAAFRLADLQIPILRHVAAPLVEARGARQVRIRMEQIGLISEMMWIVQRQEAKDYNNYFLFTKDLNDTNDLSGQDLWWPNASFPSWDFGDGYVKPGFADRRSDPIQRAAFYIKGKERFGHNSPAFFRSMIPALGSRRAPVLNRYVYRYDFGLWPTGGLAEAYYKPRDEIRGAANWSLLPAKELILTMNQAQFPPELWQRNSGAPTVRDLSWCDVSGLGGYLPNTLCAPLFLNVDNLYPFLTDGYFIELFGNGAYVSGYIDYQQLRSTPGFSGLSIRAVPFGSASVVANFGGTYKWIAVAAGYGDNANPRFPGGRAGDAVSIGGQGGTNIPTHEASGTQYGGGGGGRLRREHPGPGQGVDDGITMPTNDDKFVTLLLSTGGSTLRSSDISGNSCEIAGPKVRGTGGDGYYGGGSGTIAGGGGGSYVSDMINSVTTYPFMEPNENVRIRIIPLKRIINAYPALDIYIWLKRYNILRIYGGRGALMFAV